jgi:hypothetical protein
MSLATKQFSASALVVAHIDCIIFMQDRTEELGLVQLNSTKPTIPS